MAHQKTKSLQVLYWNIRSYLQRQHEVRHILQDFDVCVLVETWLLEHTAIRIPGFKLLRKDRLHSRGGGILFFIRNNLAFREIDNISSPDPTVEICGVEINNVNPSREILACNRSPGATLSRDLWHAIIQNVKNNKNSILVGDFNAHHTFWNCDNIDANGTRLAEAIDAQNLILHNTNSFSYIDVHRDYKSNLDLVISSTLASDILHATVLDETWGSDHYPIHITVDSEKCSYTKKTFKIKSKRTDWNQIKSLLDLHYDNFLAPEYDLLAPKEKYDYFIETISNTVRFCTPRKKSFISTNLTKNPVRWWDADCDNAKNARRAAFKNWEKTKDLSDLIEYKKCTALAKKLFKEKKKECFINFAVKIDFHTNSKYVWDTVKILKKSWVNTSPLNTTQHLQNNNNIEIALDKISPPWVATNPDSLPLADPNPFFDTSFNFIEFNAALDSKTAHTSPGIDGIDYEILQALPSKYKLLLVDIFNEMYRANSYPDTWKQSFIHFILKPDNKNYRPIALTSCTCKLFETIIKNRLQWWAETHNFIPTSQSGFRKGKSCIDNLTSLTLKIDEAFVEKKKCSCRLFRCQWRV